VTTNTDTTRANLATALRAYAAGFGGAEALAVDDAAAAAAHSRTLSADEQEAVDLLLTDKDETGCSWATLHKLAHATADVLAA